MTDKKKFTIENQCKKNVLSSIYKDCPYYPCHDVELNNFTCIFCYCPFYCKNNTEKGCTNVNGTGEWYYYRYKGEKIKVWDCSDCIYPHKIENAINILLSFYNDNK